MKGWACHQDLYWIPKSGWYYGFIPDQGLTEITYSFNIQVSQTDNPSIASQLYPFTLTITGVTDSEVTWITPSNLGVIENGSTSILNVEAVNRGGATMKYRLASGEFNQLPQGLTLLPTGEIAGRTTFNTFAVDLGFTTFDATQSNITGISETNFDTEFTFTVNAYAEDTGQLLYNVASVNITNGGSGYSTINLPTLQFSSPVGATAVTAVGNAVVTGSAITAVTLTEQGAGYTSATYHNGDSRLWWIGAACVTPSCRSLDNVMPSVCSKHSQSKFTERTTILIRTCFVWPCHRPMIDC
jgi:hypothetical protein